MLLCMMVDTTAGPPGKFHAQTLICAAREGACPNWPFPDLLAMV